MLICHITITTRIIPLPPLSPILAHELIPQMVHRKEGKLLFVSSVWGNVGASMEVAYSASKGGINSFTRALAKELAPSNIQVNEVAFGVIDTQMNRCFSEEERRALKEEIPADRMGTCLLYTSRCV